MRIYGKIENGVLKILHNSNDTKEKLATPQNISVEGNVISWDAVENAESYDIYADGILIGNNLYSGTTITITSKLATTRKSVDLTTLSGWTNLSDGEHEIQIMAKGIGYRDSEKSSAVTFTKGSASTGETWVLNETLSGTINIDTNFTSNSTQYTNITLKDSKGDIEMMYSSTLVYSNGNWNDNAYKTITFETAPIGDLLTWLQKNGTKSSSKVLLSLPKIPYDATVDDNWELQQTTIEVDNTIKTAIEKFNAGIESTYDILIDAVINLTTDEDKKKALNELKESLKDITPVTRIGIHPVAIKSITPNNGEYLIKIQASYFSDWPNMQMLIYDYVNNTLEKKDVLSYDPEYGTIEMYIPKTNGDLLLIPYI